MGRTPYQLVIDLESILGCGHGNVTIHEDFDTYSIEVEVGEGTIDRSLFDREQFHHIVKSLTPPTTGVNIIVTEGDEPTDSSVYATNYPCE